MHVQATEARASGQPTSIYGIKYGYKEACIAEPTTHPAPVHDLKCTYWQPTPQPLAEAPFIAGHQWLVSPSFIDTCPPNLCLKLGHLTVNQATNQAVSLHCMKQTLMPPPYHAGLSSLAISIYTYSHVFFKRPINHSPTATFPHANVLKRLQPRRRRLFHLVKNNNERTQRPIPLL